MRAQSKWTPGGVLLWLIATVLATLIVCSQSEPATDALPVTEEVEIELELIE